MEIIDRYLRTLRIFLPKNHRDDVIRELSEEIRSQVAEQEVALGRPLTADEQAAIVKQYGHPMLTAARYRPQRYLIGPVVFPYYWIALKLALALVAIGHLLGAAVLLVSGTPVPSLGQLLENAIGIALKVAAWITVLGAGADFYLARSGKLEKWNPIPGALPRHTHDVVRSALAGVRGAQIARDLQHPRSGEASMSGLVTAIVLSAWWLAGLRFPVLFFGSGADGLEWGNAMQRVYPVLVVAQLTMLAELFVKYFRPDNTRIFRVTRFVWLIGGATLVYFVATSDHQWMVWRADSFVRANVTVLRFAGRDISLAEFVNLIWSTLFIIVAVLSAWGFLKSVLNRFRGTPMTVHTAPL